MDWSLLLGIFAGLITPVARYLKDYLEPPGTLWEKTRAFVRHPLDKFAAGCYLAKIQLGQR